MITVAGRVVTPRLIIDDGIVRIDGDRIVAVESGPPPAESIRAEYVLPGLVDLHCHGGGGASVEDGGASAVAAFHADRGTTSMLASLVSAPLPTLARQLDGLVPLVADGTLLGAHLEGPYLSPDRRGAHPVAALREPDQTELAWLLAAGIVSMVTVAPELPYASKLIELATGRGVVVALGHTAADGEQIRAALDAGATVATHLWNGMPPLHHREDGAVATLLTDPRVRCELIADGHHLSADILRLSLAALGPNRAILVTDAASPTGCADGRYRLGGEDVDLHRGLITTADGRSLAGSAITLLEAVRQVVGLGHPLLDAVRAASVVPAGVVRADDIGQIATAKRADLVLTDADLQLQAVLHRGVWR